MAERVEWTEHEDPAIAAIADRLNAGGGHVSIEGPKSFKIVRSSGLCFRPGDKKIGISHHGFSPSLDWIRPVKIESGEPNGVLGVWELYCWLRALRDSGAALSFRPRAGSSRPTAAG